MTDKSFIGGGKLHIDGRFIGNVPQLDLSFESDSKDLTDFTSPGGGLYNSVERITSVGFSFQFNDYNGDNLALALFGTASQVASAVIANDESLTAPADVSAGDRLLRTAKVIDTSQSYALDTDPATGPYTEGTDYTVSPAGFTILASGSIPDGQALLAGYTSKAVDLVQALVNSGQEFEMVFDGFNDAQSGLPVRVIAYRAKPGAADGLPLIGEDFAANTVNGKILKDSSITAQGLSQYFTVEAA